MSHSHSKIILSISVIVLFFAMISNSFAVGATIAWESDIAAAKSRAAKEGKVLLLHFSGDHCPPCRMMERDIFPNPQVVQMLNENYVAVKIDTNENPKLVKEYNVRGIPADYYYSPKGEMIHQRIGGSIKGTQLNAQTYLAELKNYVGTPLNQQVPPNGIMPQQIAQQIPAPQPQNMNTNFADYPPFPVAPNQGVTLPVAQPVSQQQILVPAISAHGMPETIQNRAAVIAQNGPAVVENDSFAAGFASSGGAAQVASGTQNIVAQPAVAMRPQVSMVQNVPVQFPETQTMQTAQVPMASPQVTLSTVVPVAVPVVPQASTPTPHITMMAQVPVAPVVPATPTTTPIAMPSSFATTPPAQNFQPQTNFNTPASAVGEFSSGVVRKNPQTGLGAGMSLGVTSERQANLSNTERPKVALDGYCPVTLSELSAWVKGKTEWSIEFDQQVFHFVSQAALEKFRANPIKYAPVLGGNDVVELVTNQQNNVHGLRKFGAWYQERIFLFANSANYEKFQSNPELYSTLAQKQHVAANANATIK